MASLGSAVYAAEPTGHGELQNGLKIEVGAHYPTVTTTAFLKSNRFDVGTEVSFEDQLDLDDRKAIGTYLLGWRFLQRWKIELEYFRLNRSGQRPIDIDIEWGDHTFTIGTVVGSEFESETWHLSGAYSFVYSPRGEFGIQLGLHSTEFLASLSASGVGGSDGEALAPLPTLGLYGRYAFTPKVLLSGRVEVFSLDYEEYDGTVTDATAKVDYRFLKQFGIGVGYRYLNYSLAVTKTRFTGGIDYEFTGPVAFLVGAF